MTPGFLGNEAIVSRLEARVRNGKFPHAVVFSGPEGVGKRTLALRLSQAMNCETGSVPACGECGPCARIARGTHPDVRMIGIEDDASKIGIEQIRELRAALELAPAEGRVRTWIIDPAERMSSGAANALLKVLEEPPARVCFFLVTPNVSELLLTIRSRCQVHHFAPLPLAALRALGDDDEWLVRSSGGSIGWLRQADPESVRVMRDQMLDLLEAGILADPADLAQRIGGALTKDREEFALRLRASCHLVSDLLRLRVDSEDRIVNVDVRDRLAALCQRISIGGLVEVARALLRIEKDLKSYLNIQLISDDLLISLGRRSAAAD